jgi:hypothetical protein
METASLIFNYSAKPIVVSPGLGITLHSLRKAIETAGSFALRRQLLLSSYGALGGDVAGATDGDRG